ncbi:S41 family peptidase [Actinocatenispora sera]|uniref:S41 family peptidase n=1 Tax=Actinocatenispora sera TaxID=390989 RepID=UPI0033D12646
MDSPTADEAVSGAAARADLDHLVEVLTDAHPDAYHGFGGAVAFWRAVSETRAAIPASGLTATALYGRLARLAAGVRDAHTALFPPGRRSFTDPAAPRYGIDWDVVDGALVVGSVHTAGHRPLLRARLRAVDGVAFDELVERMRRLRGYDNAHGNLVHLAQALDDPAAASLLTGAAGDRRVELATSGGPTEVTLAPWRPRPADRLAPTSRLPLPVPGPSGIATAMLGPVGYLRLGELLGYREVFENARVDGVDWLLGERLDTALERLGVTGAPPRVDERIALVPSASEAIGGLLDRLRTAGGDRLVVDLRHCPGGNSIIGDILATLLYGVDGVLDGDEGYQVPRYSPRYFQHYRDSPATPGYDFGAERDWLATRSDPHARRRRRRAALTELRSRLPAFDRQLARAAIPPAPRVAVVVDAFTFSAGFDVLLALRRHGATVVGTAPAQAANCFIDILPFQLHHSGLRGMVSFKWSVSLPDEPDNGTLLRPDVPLTAAEYDLDPNAAVLLALDHLDHDRARTGAGTSTDPGACGTAPAR